MGHYVEGEEVDVDNLDRWNALQPVVGAIIECGLLSSSLAVASDECAAFFITSVETRLDGSILLEARFMGVTDQSLSGAIEGLGRHGVVQIHLCLSRPCVAVDPHVDSLVALHVTTVRMWSEANFEADYLMKDIDKKVAQWKKELKKDGGGPGGEPKKRATPKRKATEAGRGKKPGAGRGAGPPGKKPAGKPPKSGLTAEMRKELSRRLERAKRGRRAESPDTEVEKEEFEEVSEDAGEVSSAEEIRSSAEEGGEITTGTLVAGGRRATRKARAKGSPDDGGALAIKDGTMKSLSSQLALRAAAVAGQRKKEREKKKSKKKSKADVAVALVKILTGASDKEKKKKKRGEPVEKDNKKKKRRRKLADGTIVSCSSDCSSSLETGEEDQATSDSDMEAPIKRRSRDHPGSVLSLLTNHVREQLEQSSVMDLPKTGSSVTGGVKVSTYFALQIKPQYPQQQRELRELHSLAATLDLLRQGDIARVGDSLAARFMAIHQSLIDQSWNTAKFMELHSMEETSAGSAAIVLASRKHSKLVDKVQGRYPGSWGNWGGYGRGRGKGGWKGQSDASGGAKGDKGKGREKGKKGKGKGSGWDQKVNSWEKAKEKPEEK